MRVSGPFLCLCADVGGTKTLMGVMRVEANARVSSVHLEHFWARNYESFDALLEQYLSRAEVRSLLPLPAVLAVAGPVIQGTVQMTNLPWRLAADTLQALTGGTVHLVNDFTAAAAGIDALTADRLLALQVAPAQEHAAQLVLGAGSGLGVAWRIWNGQHYQILSGEGGHMGFAPLDSTQDALLGLLRQQHPRLVCEHVVSGPGLVNLYQALAATSSQAALPAANATLSAADIQTRAAQGELVALQAVAQFLRSYAAIAGDHALSHLCTGGVFLAGGIAGRWKTWMQDGRFIQAFRDKGPYAELMRSMPVYLVDEPNLGLLGAALLAAQKNRR